jgi:chromo domain-containing protein 1
VPLRVRQPLNAITPMANNRVDEFRKAESSLIREDLSSSRQSSGPRVISVREEADKAAIEGQIATGSSRDSARKPLAQSPLPTATSTPPKLKPRPAWNPRDPLNAICFFLASTGVCPEERGCQYIHSNDRNLAVAPSPLEITGRPAWKSRNPLNAICYFLASTGSCTQGSRCKFFHSNDPTLPIAPSPSHNEATGPPEYDDRGRQTCRYWLRDDCKYKNNTCRFWHGPLSAKEQHDIAREQASSPTKPTPTGPRMKSVSFAIDEDMPLVEEPEGMSSSNQRLEKPRPPLRSSEAGLRYPDITCPYWTKGYCQRGSSCWYRHANVVDERSSRHVQDVQMNDTHIPARRIESSRDVEMQDRVEKHSKNTEMKDADEAARPAIPRKPSVRFDPMTNDRSLAMSESENLPSNPTEVQIASQPKNNPFEPPPELPNPSSDTTVPAPKAKQRIKMDDYRRKKAFNELGDRAKEVTFGIDETQSLMLDFGDMNQVLELPWGRFFTGITKVRFDQMCIAQDFQAQQGLLQRLRLWHGNLLPADASDPEAVKSIDKAADELVRKSVGLFSSFPNFLVLAFPAKKDEWKFLESTIDYPQDTRARLRYFIFQSDVDIRQSSKMNPTSLAIGAPYRDILVNRVHGLDFKKLLPIAKKSRPPNFYLLFPSTASQCAEFIILWLRSSKPTCKIYSSQSEGSWHYFTHTPEIDNGVILVHESAAAELYRLPNLYSIVVEKRFTFWYLSESNSPYPLFPSTSYDFDDSTMGQLNAIRLFPHGCAFLLTPSFLVAEPHNAYQILSWFLGGGKPKYLLSTPRTWKLVCCHNFADYILELANSKAAEKDTFELKYQNDPAKDAKLYDAGLSFNECNLRYKLHKLLVDFESRQSLESISEFDSDESDYPFIYANKHINPDDEKGLVNWYAAWTMRNLDMYMKFIVVGSSEPKHRERLVRIKETEVVMEGTQSLLIVQKPMALAETAKLSASPGNNGSKEREEQEQNPFDNIALKAATNGINLDKQIDELIAESSNTSPGLDTAKETSHTNGSSTNPLPISGSTSHPYLQSLQFNGAGDQSVNMEIDSPMLGFNGAGDERPTSSSNNTPRSGIQSNENDRRFVASPVVGGSSAIDVDSDSGGGAEAGSGNERARREIRWMPAESVDGKVEEVVKEKKVEEVKFEATTTWYKKVVKEGRGWEHIRVEGWEGANRSLGVGK